MRHILFFVFSFVVFSAHAVENRVELAPTQVVVEPKVDWQTDAIIPSKIQPVNGSSRGPSLMHGFSEDLPFAIADYGDPGELKQFRGLGRSAEDISVETLGVSVNPIQGGGFDFTTFPSFLWSTYEYQWGPTRGESSFSSVSGRLALSPWSETALDLPEVKSSLGYAYSSRDVHQVSAAGKTSGETSGAAAIMGYSAGRMKGPSGATSMELKWGAEKKSRTRLHFIGSQIESAPQGSKTFRSPDAEQTVTEIIPAIENIWQGDDVGKLTSRVFYHGQHLRYDDHKTLFRSTAANIGREWGGQTYWKRHSWSLGGNLQYREFRSLTIASVSETQWGLQLAKEFYSQTWTIEPAVHLKGVTRYGEYPEFHLGFKSPIDLEKKDTFFSRLSYTRKIPSFLDRYYNLPAAFFMGNPNLMAEKVFSTRAGVKFDRGEFQNTAEFVFQFRDDTFVNQTNSSTFITRPENVGSANALSGHHDFAWRISPQWQARSLLAITMSHIESSSNDYPYLPNYMQTSQLSFWPSPEKLPLETRASARFSAGANANTTGTLKVPAYALWNFETHYYGPISAGLRVENITDHKPEIVFDYPLPGRTFIASIEAQF